MAKKKNNPNLLPETEKKDLNGSSQSSGAPDIKLVVPEMEMKPSTDTKKKESWFARRRRKKALKRAQKLRLKGETGTAPAQMKKEQSIQTSSSSNVDLFEDVDLSNKTESKPVMPKSPQPTSTIQAESPNQAKNEVKAEPKEVQTQPEVKEVKKEEKVEEKKVDSKPQMPVEPSKSMHQPSDKLNFSGPAVNLVSSSYADESSGSNLLIGGIIVLVTIGFWVILGGFAVSKVQSAKAQVAEREQKVTQLDLAIKEFDVNRKTAQALQKQIQSVEGVVENHLYWSKFFEKLASTTIPDVYYVGVNADTSGNRVTLEAIAKNYDSAARQIRAFELTPDFVTAVSVNEARVENQPGAELPVPIIAFDLSLTLNEDFLSLVEVTE